MGNNFSLWCGVTKKVARCVQILTKGYFVIESEFQIDEFSLQPRSNGQVSCGETESNGKFLSWWLQVSGNHIPLSNTSTHITNHSITAFLNK